VLDGIACHYIILTVYQWPIISASLVSVTSSQKIHDNMNLHSVDFHISYIEGILQIKWRMSF